MKNLKILNEKMLKKCSLITSSTILSGMLLISGCGMKKSEAEVVKVTPTATIEVTPEVTSTPEPTATPVPMPTIIPEPQEKRYAYDLNNEEIKNLTINAKNYYMEWWYYDEDILKYLGYSCNSFDNAISLLTKRKCVYKNLVPYEYTYLSNFIDDNIVQTNASIQQLIASEFFDCSTEEYRLLKNMEIEYNNADKSNDPRMVANYFNKYASLCLGKSIDGFSNDSLSLGGILCYCDLLHLQLYIYYTCDERKLDGNINEVDGYYNGIITEIDGKEVIASDEEERYAKQLERIFRKTSIAAIDVVEYDPKEQRNLIRGRNIRD